MKLRFQKIHVGYWVFGIVLFLAVGLFSCAMSASMQALRMTNEDIRELRSPDGKYVATLAYRDGLTEGFYYVSLSPAKGWHHLQANDPIPDDEVAEVAAEGLEKIAWAGSGKLIVTYDATSSEKAEFAFKKTVWHGVRIVYRGD